jgi:hypothetical protein
VLTSLRYILSNNAANPWALLPLQIDNEILSFIPINQPIEIYEAQLIAEFNALCQMFHVVRRTKDYLNNKLGGALEFDIGLGKIYQKKLQLQIDDTVKNSEIILSRITEFTDEILKSNKSIEERLAWEQVVQVCSNKFRTAKELVNNKLSDEENQDFWSNREVDNYLGKYLNIKYQRFN